MSILCKLGFHKRDPERYVEVRRKKGKHKWHRNYFVCTRCGKLYMGFSKHKERRTDNERKAD